MTLGFGQLFSIIDGVPSPWNTILKVLLVIGGIVGLLASTVRFVPQGFHGLRARWGKVIVSKKTGEPIVVTPSRPRFIIPKFYTLILVDARDRTFKCGPTQLQYGQRLVNVTAIVTFALHRAYYVEYRVTDLNERVFAACTSALREVLAGVQNGDIDSHRRQICEDFVNRVAWLKEELGLGCKALDITDVEYNPLAQIAEAIGALGSNPLDMLRRGPKSSS